MPEKNWKVELSKSSFKYLEKLEKRKALRILDQLNELETTQNPAFHKGVRPLTGKLKGFYRLKIGGIRIIFELDWGDERIGILTIFPKGKAY